MKRFVEFDDATLAAHNNHQKKHVLAELDSLVQSSVFVCPIHRRYLRKIRQFVDERDCLIAGAEELKEMVFEIENIYFNWEVKIPPMLAIVNDRLSEIFSYENFRKARKNGGDWLMRKVVSHVKYCPYCNAETIYSLERDKKGDIKSALDHFFPHGRYPFLAISLHNLIPSCYRCNSQFKQDHFTESYETFHPYIDDFDDNVEFFPKCITLDMLEGNANGDGLKIVLKPRSTADTSVTQEKIDNYNVLFAINTVYTQLFSEEALDILRKTKVLNEDYLEQVCKWFEGANLKVDVDRIIYNTRLDPNDIDRHRLSKLTMDLRRNCHRICNGK